MIRTVAFLCVVLLIGSAELFAQSRRADIINANVMAAIESTPALPIANPVRSDTNANLPRAILITPNYQCPACETWKSRLDELPFNVEVQVQPDSPTGSFPCLWYSGAASASGWAYSRAGQSVDQFLEELKRPLKAVESKPPHVTAAPAKAAAQCTTGNCQPTGRWRWSR